MASRRTARRAGARPAAGAARRNDTTIASRRALLALDQLHDTPLNFDLTQQASFTAERGWHIDDYCQALGRERPGGPEPGGVWETAVRMVREYEFADPKIVRAIYHPDRPIEHREMLLEGRFYGLTFFLGLRVGGVVDRTCEHDGRQLRVWGWNYQTLQGHLEMGQMDYQVWKWLDTGEVEFRIHAFSRPARIPNPVVRLGFKVFGRHMQTRFATSALIRLRGLIDAEMARRHGESVVDEPAHAVEEIDVRPAADDATAQRHLAEG
jgi:uncharacterized protein (UPF0548 family)